MIENRKTKLKRDWLMCSLPVLLFQEKNYPPPVLNHLTQAEAEAAFCCAVGAVTICWRNAYRAERCKKCRFKSGGVDL